jgi:hypothetical protein
MKGYWTNEVNGRRYGVHLHEKGAVVIWESDGNPHTEIGRAYTYRECLAGSVDSFVNQYLSAAVLAELKEAVKLLV